MCYITGWGGGDHSCFWVILILAIQGWWKLLDLRARRPRAGPPRLCFYNILGPCGKPLDVSGLLLPQLCRRGWGRIPKVLSAWNIFYSRC